MNGGLKLLGKVVRDLLDKVETDVVMIGRRNFDRDDFTSLQIVIDSVVAASIQNSPRKFDSDNESMAHTISWLMPCTISFYGDSAWAEAVKFTALIQSQAGYELQRDYGVAVFNPGQVTDLRFLSGAQYSERYDIDLNIRFATSQDIDTLRIDTAVLDTFLVND